jgi:hypothetical protein
VELPGLNSWGKLLTEAGEQAGQVRLRRSLDEAAKPGTDVKALEKSAEEFEGVFLNTLLKAMRQTVPENDLFNGGGATKFYRQMHDAEIAKTLATGHSGMGIADMIVRQLSRDGENETTLPPSGPKVLARYREVMPLGPDTPVRSRLTRLAAQQGTTVADTLGRFQREIESASWGSGLDPALILSVVMEESGGDPGARSSKGALGLMQLMPETARELGVADRTDAAQNLQGGARYLADMLKKFAGQLDVALAAYNAGPGTVDRLGGKIPDYPETRRYVRRVLERYEQLGGGTPLASPKP